jgi:hypothetical protein
MLATEIPLSVPRPLIRCCPDIVLLGYDFGLTYHRETYTNLSARTEGSDRLAIGNMGTHPPTCTRLLSSKPCCNINILRQHWTRSTPRDQKGDASLRDRNETIKPFAEIHVSISCHPSPDEQVSEKYEEPKTRGRGHRTPIFRTSHPR